MVVDIIFKGKTTTIHNSIDEELFEKVYKPKGWVLANAPKEENIETKIMKEEKVAETQEQKIKSIKRTAKAKPQSFNDKLIKEDKDVQV